MLVSLVTATITSDVFALVLVHWLGYSLALLAICYSLNVNDGSTEISATSADITASWVNNTVFVSAAASAAGLPPFFGFWTKTAFFVYTSLTSSFFLAALCALLILFGLFFYLSIIRAVSSEKKFVFSNNINFLKIGVVVVLIMLFNVFGFLFFDDLLILAKLLI